MTALQSQNHLNQSLLEMLGLNAVSSEEQEEMLLTLSDIVFRGSLVRLVERMDDKARVDFANLCEKGASEEVVSTFLKERVPGGDSVVKETIDELASDVAALDIPVHA